MQYPCINSNSGTVSLQYFQSLCMSAVPSQALGPFQTPPFIPSPWLSFVSVKFQIVWMKEFLIWSTGRICLLPFISASSDVRHSLPALTGQLPKQGWAEGTKGCDVCRVIPSEWESRGESLQHHLPVSHCYGTLFRDPPFTSTVTGVVLQKHI